jgi:hypothetical protein
MSPNLINLYALVDVTKPYKFIGFGARYVIKPYEFIWFRGHAWHQTLSIYEDWGHG